MTVNIYEISIDIKYRELEKMRKTGKIIKIIIDTALILFFIINIIFFISNISSFYFFTSMAIFGKFDEWVLKNISLPIAILCLISLILTDKSKKMVFDNRILIALLKFIIILLVCKIGLAPYINKNIGEKKVYSIV